VHLYESLTRVAILQLKLCFNLMFSTSPKAKYTGSNKLKFLEKNAHLSFLSVIYVHTPEIRPSESILRVTQSRNTQIDTLSFTKLA